ncbi:MAG: Gfo/Idh/MocA family oxidoreductase [Planctomycetes bacterium]|nr:Gfo/Idh/MocA family oxidoreductase [Planctomycetota bacterium]
MSRRTRLTRRRLLQGAAAAALAGPYIVSADALGLAARPSASNRLGIAGIGVGGRGGGHMRSLLQDDDVQVLAVCDVDRGRAVANKNVIEKHYSGVQGTTYAGCDTYKDFREVLDRPDVDAVVIGAPDHWHSLLTVYAARAGKDIYCEKPVSNTILEGRKAADAVKRYGRVFQTGSQERSRDNCRYAGELVQNGYLGKVHTIRVFLPKKVGPSGCKGPEPIPEGFDYDMWLGPRPWEPYHPRRCHGTFRWIRDYSDGELTDRGAHTNDIALLAAEPLLKGPATIIGKGRFIDDPLFDVATEYNVEFQYASGIRYIVSSEQAPPDVICSITGDRRGIKFEGDRGWLFVAIHGGALKADPPDLLKTKIGPGEIHLGRSPDHRRNWLDAIKTRGPTVAPAEDGHRTATFCHLTDIACWLDRKLVWDFDKEEFVNDPGANAMRDRPARSPWNF